MFQVFNILSGHIVASIMLQNFGPNPYFEDTKITKSFTFHDEGTKITATSIKWKEGMVWAFYHQLGVYLLYFSLWHCN